MPNPETCGEGPAILFIHGFPLDRWMWHHQVAGLGGWRRIAPDLPGFGESPPATGPVSMTTYVREMERTLDEAGVDTAVLCGLSMGGYVLFECLRQWPERISGIVLMDTRADADTAEARSGRDRLIAAVRLRGAGAAAEAMMPRLLGSTTAAAAPSWAAELRARIERTPAAGVVSALEAIRDRPDSAALLGAIRVPALVVVGAEDVITPPALAESMAAAIPGSSLEVVPGAGHLPPLEQPGRVTGALRAFLGRLV